MARPSIPTKLSGSECSLGSRQCGLAFRDVSFPAESLYSTQEALCFGVLEDCSRFGSVAVTGARMGDGAACSFGSGS